MSRIRRQGRLLQLGVHRRASSRNPREKTKKKLAIKVSQLKPLVPTSDQKVIVAIDLKLIKMSAFNNKVTTASIAAYSQNEFSKTRLTPCKIGNQPLFKSPASVKLDTDTDTDTNTVMFTFSKHISKTVVKEVVIHHLKRMKLMSIAKVNAWNSSGGGYIIRPRLKGR